jgi:hypothetical protein
MTKKAKALPKGAGKKDNSLLRPQFGLTSYFPDDGTWSPFPRKEEFLEFINPPSGEPEVKPGALIVQKKLPFLKGGTLIKCINDTAKDEAIFYMNAGDETVHIVGTRDSLDEAVAIAGGLDLRLDTALDYLKFFCLFIKDGESGEPYYLVEKTGSEFIASYSPYRRKRVLRNFQPPVARWDDARGLYRATGRILHWGQVFDAQFNIFTNGDIDMTDDTLVISL